MQIYIADLDAYNNGCLKGEWIELPTENKKIQEVILRQSKNGQSDFAIHDYELPFEIGEYTDPIKVNKLCKAIEDLDLNKYLIEHLEYSYGIDIKNTDIHTLKNYLDEVYTLDASDNYEFTKNYLYEFYEELMHNMPWEIFYSIDYNTVFDKLQMTMNITKNPDDSVYYYSYQ